jgi:hypothetical protein
MAYTKGKARYVYTGPEPARDAQGKMTEEDQRIHWHVKITHDGEKKLRDVATAIQDGVLPDGTPYGQVALAMVPQDLQDQMLDALGACVFGWSNVVDEAGQPVPYSFEELAEADLPHRAELLANLGNMGKQVVEKAAPLPLG